MSFYSIRKGICVFALSLFFIPSFAQHADLACTNNAYRNWWDVQHYELHDFISPKQLKTGGFVICRAKVCGKSIDTLQINLQAPLQLEKVLFEGAKLRFIRSKNAYLIVGNFAKLELNASFSLILFFSGSPVEAKMAPRDGGFVRKKDSLGNPFWAVACQGIGASVWWPCKDYPADEPDNGVDLFYTTDCDFPVIGNGKYIEKITKGKKTTYHWQVKSPINLYDITFYLGDFVSWKDSLQGEKGKLMLDFYVLREHLEKAKKQFDVVKPMLRCFEAWFGPYPFYEDGYKLVEAPYLGMEHQSAVAYGNNYQMGYMGKDRSQTGIGMLFDFIIVHESGHEWFGNSISSNDVAYSWIHEGFTTYSESILIECLFGKEKANLYQQGQWKIIRNKGNVEGVPNECDGGSSDQYEKASGMIHTIRQVMNDDEKFKSMLRKMNESFYHRCISGEEMEHFINAYTQMDFSKVFEQYLRTQQLPELHFKLDEAKHIYYCWKKTVANFDLCVDIQIGEQHMRIYPTDQWKILESKEVSASKEAIQVNPNYLLKLVWE